MDQAAENEDVTCSDEVVVVVVVAFPSRLGKCSRRRQAHSSSPPPLLERPRAFHEEKEGDVRHRGNAICSVPHCEKTIVLVVPADEEEYDEKDELRLVGGEAGETLGLPLWRCVCCTNE